MKLRKKCKFDHDNQDDMMKFHTDMDKLLEESREDKTPEGYVNRLSSYLSERPNIQESLNPNGDFEIFVREIAVRTLKARSFMASVMNAAVQKLKDEGIDPSDIDFSKSEAMTIGIQSPRPTGNRIFDTLEQQEKITKKDMNDFLNDPNVAKA